ncbi:MAG: alanine transaminase [Deferribacteres bacterium]|nr:alanine transaminase [candidate division KSB1 bacterium]MCB9503569.1 alanine transaminase [Deferribacteres bacterium]
MKEFQRIDRLPPYVFAIVNDLKMEARRAGDDIIDLGMGNPDQPPPPHIIEKLVEAAQKPTNHRYSVSRGIYKLRLAICDWYKRKFDVELDPDSEAIATIGSKEGLSHLMLSIINPGDVVFCPNPAYPIHPYAVIIAGGLIQHIPMGKNEDFFQNLLDAWKNSWPHPKMIILNFPNNPTTATVDLAFFEKIVDFAREHNILVVHDLAYAEICYDGYEANSILQVKGARDVAVEFYSLSKTYNMAGWRVGFCVGNKKIVSALQRMKSYLDYGMFTPIQVAATVALNGPQACISEIRATYAARRDTLCEGMNRIGWKIDPPKSTMFIWAEIPEQFRKMGSLEFSKFLLKEANVAVSPGIGFGEYGDDYVRLSLIENEHRMRQAVRGFKKALG